MTLLQQELVQLLADGVPFIVDVVDVAGSLVVQLEDGPLGLHTPLALVRVILGWARPKKKRSRKTTPRARRIVRGLMVGAHTGHAFARSLVARARSRTNARTASERATARERRVRGACNEDGRP